MELAVGVDLGKTNVRAALIDRAGNVLCFNRESAAGFKSTADITAAVVRSVRACMTEDDSVIGVGIGSYGVIDPEKGVVRSSGSLQFVRDYHIVDEVSHNLGLPAVLLNDVATAALGESVYGLGVARLSYLAFGTGVGVGLVRDSVVDLGANGTLGLVSTIKLPPGSRSINNLLGGSSIRERLVRQHGDQIDLQSDLDGLLDRDDSHAVTIVEEAVEAAVLLINFVRALHDPNIVVIAGGVWTGIERLRSAVLARCNVGNIEDSLGTAAPPVVDSALHGNAGVLGAATLVFRRVDRKPAYAG